MLVHIKEIVGEAIRKNYTVGAFNVHNFETILGVATAANKANSPAIIQVSEGVIKYMGLRPLIGLVTEVANYAAQKAPVALHIDHCKSFDMALACINAGFTSVHVDGSDLPLKENIELTNRVAKALRNKDVWIQAEVGPIAGSHGGTGAKIENIPIVDFDELMEFVRSTNVNTIAAAVGTAHGAYANEDINFKLLKKIKNSINTPFVLHGASGIENAKIKKAIKMGVNIINIGTDIKLAFCQTLIEYCRNNPTEYDPRNLLRPTIDAVQRVAIEKMKLFGSANRVK